MQSLSKNLRGAVSKQRQHEVHLSRDMPIADRIDPVLATPQTSVSKAEVDIQSIEPRTRITGSLALGARFISFR